MTHAPTTANGPRVDETTNPRSASRRPGRDLCLRSFDFEFEERAGGSDGRTLEGYAAVFNAPARITDRRGEYDEVILPGAFKRSIERRMPVLQFDHGKDPRIGTAPIGTFEKLAEDSRGLHVRARLFDHPDIERVRLAIEGRAITGMSFRFGVPNGGEAWSSRSGDVDLRAISETETHELGPVVFPAYNATSVSVRSLLAQLDPAEYRELIEELKADLRLAFDLNDLTGRPDAERAGGGDPGPEPSSGDVPPPSQKTLRMHERALKAIGVL